MIYKLGTIMGHIGHPPPESSPFAAIAVLGIDVALVRKAVQKLYFEEVPVVDSRGKPVPSYETYHDVFFVPNETKHGSIFAMKYGTKIDDR
jgi:hypothetical protein